MPRILISNDGKNVFVESVSRYTAENLRDNGKARLLYFLVGEATVGTFVNKRVFVAGQPVVIAVEETHVSDLLDTVCAANRLYAACKEAGVQSDYELQLKEAGMIH